MKSTSATCQWLYDAYYRRTLDTKTAARLTQAASIGSTSPRRRAVDSDEPRAIPILGTAGREGGRDLMEGHDTC